MSISKITAALASAHNENTLALANINFDFSLFKVEAPTEYQALGASLSNKRRTEAEAGTQHITARKLGALFDQIPPSTPNLSKAYGLRVSEISANKAVNPRGTKSDGFFTSYVGADGTAIWAAATSGQAAISVHLLACMLARMWSGPEATSVWVELVKSRKREIETMYDQGEPMNFQVLSAAQQDLTRTQLADWDASARAWLQTADEAKMREQKQLMLILKNVRLPVNHNMSVYRSVTQAWKTAMTMMESLIKGMPQRVQDGAVLLGLSAWHLYPDIVVLGDAMADVCLKDPLVATGGSLTIGLTNADRSDDESGVYWSLSLTRLRYYGDPVVSSRSAGGDPSRITFEQLEMAVLGSVLSGWENAGVDLFAAIDWLVALGNSFELAAQPPETPMRSLRLRESWIEILVRTARRLVKSETYERESLLMLVKLGKRRGHSFLAVPRQHPPPMFGLSSLKNLLPLLEGTEARVQYLRNLALDAGLVPTNTVIQYSNQGFFEFATAVPHLFTSAKRKRSELGSQYKCHVRWTGKTYCHCAKRCSRGRCSCTRQKIPCSQLCHAPWANVKCSNTTTITFIDRNPVLDDDSRIRRFELNGEKHISLCEASEVPLRSANLVDLVLPRIDAFRTYFVGSTTNSDGPSQGDHQDRKFDYLCGDPSCAAIFVRRNSNYSKEPRVLQDHRLTLLEVEHFLESNAVRARALITNLGRLGDQATPKAPNSTEPDQSDRDDEEPVLPTKPHSHGLDMSDDDDDGGRSYYRSLRAFELVAQVYKQLPNATVAVSVLCQTLHRASWATHNSLSRSRTFASIAMFESGSLDIEPKLLEEVMAMSSGSSIYVAAPLLCDPYERPAPFKIERIIGNVGRAGIAMLISPQNPRVREQTINSWCLINHADFDGTAEDCFKNTTLHLSFTGYEIPISTGLHGRQDIEVFLLESLVSVHDQGHWVADLNVLKHLQDNTMTGVERSSETRVISCRAGCSSFPQHPETIVPPFQLTAINNWEEFLDKPSFAGIVRAHDNWAARLALTVLSLHEGHDTYILKGRPCWRCVENGIRLKVDHQAGPDRVGVGTLASIFID